jgi:hypothetical protein
VKIHVIKNYDYECGDYGTFAVPDGVDLESVLEQIAKRISCKPTHSRDWHDAILAGLRDAGIEKLEVENVYMPEWYEYNRNPPAPIAEPPGPGEPAGKLISFSREDVFRDGQS